MVACMDIIHIVNRCDCQFDANACSLNELNCKVSFLNAVDQKTNGPLVLWQQPNNITMPSPEVRARTEPANQINQFSISCCGPLIWTCASFEFEWAKDHCSYSRTNCWPKTTSYSIRHMQSSSYYIPNYARAKYFRIFSYFFFFYFFNVRLSTRHAHMDWE